MDQTDPTGGLTHSCIGVTTEGPQLQALAAQLRIRLQHHEHLQRDRRRTVGVLTGRGQR
jgi:hypothetical protein